MSATYQKQSSKSNSKINNIKLNGQFPHKTKQSAHKLVEQQQSFGNQSIQRMIKSGTIQAKLKVSHPNDPYEIEADRVANQVMRMVDENEELDISEKNKNVVNPKQCSICQMKEDKLKISRKTSSQSDSNLEVSDEISDQINHTSGGRPLDSMSKNFMESRFNHDFSDVRIHQDSKSFELANSVNARAFAYGNNIFFGRNESLSDNQLMAHELTHVVQSKQKINRQKTNNQKSNTIYREPKVPVFDFSDESGIVVTGSPVSHYVNLFLDGVINYLQVFNSNNLSAVIAFKTKMFHDSKKKQKTSIIMQVLEKALDFGVKKILSLVETIPGGKVITAVIKAGYTHLTKAKGLSAEAVLAEFITDYVGRTSTMFSQLIQTFFKGDLSKTEENKQKKNNPDFVPGRRTTYANELEMMAKNSGDPDRFSLQLKIAANKMSPPSYTTILTKLTEAYFTNTEKHWTAWPNTDKAIGILFLKWDVNDKRTKATFDEAIISSPYATQLHDLWGKTYGNTIDTSKLRITRGLLMINDKNYYDYVKVRPNRSEPYRRSGSYHFFDKLVKKMPILKLADIDATTSEVTVEG